MEIVGWARRSSRAWRAQNGEEFKLPKPDLNYDKKSLAKRLISSPEPVGSPIGSINVRVSGLEIAAVRLEIVKNAWM
jgi:hypothetical protein